MTDRRFTHRVRYHEVDQQGYLFNGRFLEIADVAMTEFFRSIGFDYATLNAHGVDPSVVRAELACTSPARFDDVLDVEVHCTKVGTSSFRLVTVITLHGRDVARVEIAYVNVDAAVASSVPLPPTVADAMRAAIRTEEDA